MKKFFLSLLFISGCMYVSDSCYAQVTGRWTTFGFSGGEAKAIIEIYEEQGKIFGRVEKLLPASKLNTCNSCPGVPDDYPLTGMVIMKDLVKNDTGAGDGKILDPNSGRSYSCYIELETPDKLKLRGYLGIPSLGKTQYWYRVKP